MRHQVLRSRIIWVMFVLVVSIMFMVGESGAGMVGRGRGLRQGDRLYEMLRQAKDVRSVPGKVEIKKGSIAGVGGGGNNLGKDWKLYEVGAMVSSYSDKRWGEDEGYDNFILDAKRASTAMFPNKIPVYFSLDGDTLAIRIDRILLSGRGLISRSEGTFLYIPLTADNLPFSHSDIKPIALKRMEVENLIACLVSVGGGYYSSIYTIPSLGGCSFSEKCPYDQNYYDRSGSFLYTCGVLNNRVTSDKEYIYVQNGSSFCQRAVRGGKYLSWWQYNRNNYIGVSVTFLNKGIVMNLGNDVSKVTLYLSYKTK